MMNRMVANAKQIAERFVTPPEPFVAGRWLLPRLTRFDADAMVRLGIIPEDASTELLNGLIVLKDRSARGESPLMIGKDHLKAVEKLSNLRTQINTPSRHVQSQQPLICSDTHVPEPDFAVIRGSLDDYTDLPQATDAWCVVEVADSSYDRDTGEKLAGYARAGVQQYIVLNLQLRRAEVYLTPDVGIGRYAAPQFVNENGAINLRVGDGELFTVQVRDVLP